MISKPINSIKENLQSNGLQMQIVCDGSSFPLKRRYEVVLF